VLLAKVPSTIAGRFENGKIGTLTEGRIQRTRGDPIEMLAFIGAGEEAGPSHPTGGGRDEGILEADPLASQPVDVWGFDNGMPGASQSMVALIVRVENKKIGSFS
jgi:hypothetical protein